MNGSVPRAALDIGSNTIRLLVARPVDGSLETLEDASEFVRLGKGVDASGQLQPDRLEAGVRAISDLTRRAHELGAETVLAVATSAVRDARNGAEFVRRVRAEAGLEVRILSGDEEARLTFLGATLNTSTDGGAVVTDLGGGSTELVAVEGGAMRWATSLQLGSGRLTELFIRHDPPPQIELDQVGRQVRDALAGLAPFCAECAIFTGGTATHIALLLGRSEELVQLTRPDLGRVVDLLKKHRAADVAREYGVRPERAEVLPAGVQALASIAEYYGAARVTVTRHGIREGVIVDALRREAGAPHQSSTSSQDANPA